MAAPVLPVTAALPPGSETEMNQFPPSEGNDEIPEVDVHELAQRLTAEEQKNQALEKRVAELERRDRMTVWMFYATMVAIFGAYVTSALP